MSDSVRPHRRRLTRLPRPWDSPGKNTGVGCHFLLQCMKVESESEVAQLCPTLRNLMDCSLPGFSVNEIFQARVLEWGAIGFSAFILKGFQILFLLKILIAPPTVQEVNYISQLKWVCGSSQKPGGEKLGTSRLEKPVVKHRLGNSQPHTLKSKYIDGWRELALITKISLSKLPLCLRKWAWKGEENHFFPIFRSSRVEGIKPIPHHTTQKETGMASFLLGIWQRKPEWMVLNGQLFHKRCLTMRLKLQLNPAQPPRCPLTEAKPFL